MSVFSREMIKSLICTETIVSNVRQVFVTHGIRRFVHNPTKKPLLSPSYLVPDDDAKSEIERSQRSTKRKKYIPKEESKPATHKQSQVDDDYFSDNFDKVNRITKPVKDVKMEPSFQNTLNRDFNIHRGSNNVQRRSGVGVYNFKYSNQTERIPASEKHHNEQYRDSNMSRHNEYDHNDIDLLKNDDGRQSKQHSLPGLGKREPSYIRKRGQNSTPKIRAEIVFGLYPVLLALKEKRRTCYALYIKPDLLDSSKTVLKEIVQYATENNVKVKPCSVEALDALSSYRPHQGVCLDADRLTYHVLDEDNISSYTNAVQPDDPQLWVMLDSVKDPMNFGAILRSSYFLGVDRILSVKKNSCALSPVVSKASSGVLEIWPVHTIQNKISFIKAMKDFGWQIIGTMATTDEDSTSTQSIPLYDVTMETNTLLLLGNEGEGLSPEVKGHCQHLVSVLPGRKLHPGIDSLNVSVATGILLHTLAYQRKRS